MPMQDIGNRQAEECDSESSLPIISNKRRWESVGIYCIPMLCLIPRSGMTIKSRWGLKKSLEIKY